MMLSELPVALYSLARRHRGRLSRVKDRFKLGGPRYVRNRRDSLRPKFHEDDWYNPFMVRKMREQAQEVADPNSPFHLGLSSVDDLITSDIIHKRWKEGLTVDYEKISLMTEPRMFLKFVDAMNIRPERRFIINEEQGLLVYSGLNYWEYNADSSTVRVRLVGDTDFIQKNRNLLSENFNVAECFIEWMYSADGNSATVPITNERKPVGEMYPFIDEDLYNFYDRYMDSSASVLVLIGPPGTGKTTFIRGLLQQTKTNALVSYDANILEKDYIFARFVEGSNSVMVLEDADNFLGNRTDGNSVMHKFLNIGDGLITTKGKKMIFSTNLPSIKDIDPALIRPGRCFDIVEFRPLKPEEQNNLAKRLDLEDYKSSTEDRTLAEIFHTQIQSKKIAKRTMGFY